MCGFYYSYAAGDFDTYWFEKNLQGDIVAVYSANGTKLISYTYDAWGNFTTSYHNNCTSASTANYNPFRYRGYYYDTELEMYYLQTRYYDPAVGRFINPDDISYLSANGDFASYNLYAYCENNPVARKDNAGRFWTLVAKALIGVATQYVADVIGNILSGEENIFVPTSSPGEYIAAGITAIIPGSVPGSTIIKNVITEGIRYIERNINGDEVSLAASAANVMLNSVVDSKFEKLIGKIGDKLESLIPSTSSSFAGRFRKIFPDATKAEIYEEMALQTYAIRNAKNQILSSIEAIATNIKPNIYDLIDIIEG